LGIDRGIGDFRLLISDSRSPISDFRFFDCWDDAPAANKILAGINKPPVAIEANRIHRTPVGDLQPQSPIKSPLGSRQSDATHHKSL